MTDKPVTVRFPTGIVRYEIPDDELVKFCGTALGTDQAEALAALKAAGLDVAGIAAVTVPPPE